MACCDCSELEEKYDDAQEAADEAADEVAEWSAKVDDLQDELDDKLDEIRFLELRINNLEAFIQDNQDNPEVLGGLEEALDEARVELDALLSELESLAAEWAEAIFQNSFWSNEFHRRTEELNELEKQLDECKEKLETCEGCQGDFLSIPMGECMLWCMGCERWYCNDCFDPAIEKWELAQRCK